MERSKTAGVIKTLHDPQPFPSPGDLPISGIESWSPALEADSLLSTSEL